MHARVVRLIGTTWAWAVNKIDSLCVHVQLSSCFSWFLNLQFLIYMLHVQNEIWDFPTSYVCTSMRAVSRFEIVSKFEISVLFNRMLFDDSRQHWVGARRSIRNSFVLFSRHELASPQNLIWNFQPQKLSRSDLITSHNSTAGELQSSVWFCVCCWTGEMRYWYDMENQRNHVDIWLLLTQFRLALAVFRFYLFDKDVFRIRIRISFELFKVTNSHTSCVRTQEISLFCPSSHNLSPATPPLSREFWSLSIHLVRITIYKSLRLTLTIADKKLTVKWKPKCATDGGKMRVAAVNRPS